MEEREHQIAKGHDADHDDQHVHNELIKAAAVCLQDIYAAEGIIKWPWLNGDNHKKYSPMRLLAVAGAFIAAELDRRLRKGEVP